VLVRNGVVPRGTSSPLHLHGPAGPGADPAIPACSSPPSSSVRASLGEENPTPSCRRRSPHRRHAAAHALSGFGLDFTWHLTPRARHRGIVPAALLHRREAAVSRLRCSRRQLRAYLTAPSGFPAEAGREAGDRAAIDNRHRPALQLLYNFHADLPEGKEASRASAASAPLGEAAETARGSVASLAKEGTHEQGHDNAHPVCERRDAALTQERWSAFPRRRRHAGAIDTTGGAAGEGRVAHATALSRELVGAQAVSLLVARLRAQTQTRSPPMPLMEIQQERRMACANGNGAAGENCPSLTHGPVSTGGPRRVRGSARR